MIPMEPHEPLAPPAAIDWQPPKSPDLPSLVSTVADLPLHFWRWFDANTGLPPWFLPLAVGCYLFAAFGMWVMRLLGPDEEWWTTDPKDTSRVLGGDLRKDPEAAADGPRSDRWWRCRYCGIRGSLYGTVQQEAEAAHEHEGTCRARPDAPVVRRCKECAAPIDPIDDLLDGLFEDGDDEPGLTGWKPGMPAWGTPPLLPLRNQAQAELFRQMISDALRRSKGGPV